MKLYRFENFINELNTSTYLSAARKLKKIGHVNRSSNLEKHSLEMTKKEAFEKYKIKECTFEGGIIGTFLGMDVLWDMFFDNDCSFLSVLFNFDIGLKDRNNNSIGNPFGVHLDVEKNYIYIESFDQEHIFNALNLDYLVFNNRKDALKLFRLIKGFDIDELKNEVQNSSMNINDLQFEKLKSSYKKLTDLLTVNHLWRES